MALPLFRAQQAGGAGGGRGGPPVDRGGCLRQALLLTGSRAVADLREPAGGGDGRVEGLARELWNPCPGRCGLGCRGECMSRHGDVAARRASTSCRWRSGWSSIARMLRLTDAEDSARLQGEDSLARSRDGEPDDRERGRHLQPAAGAGAEPRRSTAATTWCPWRSRSHRWWPRCRSPRRSSARRAGSRPTPTTR